MSHTPGPWTVVADDTVYAFPPSTDSEAIAAGYANDAQLIAEVSIVEDARLIAAAPDLLAALVELEESACWYGMSRSKRRPRLDDLREGDRVFPAVQAARDAIAKATGGET